MKKQQTDDLDDLELTDSSPEDTDEIIPESELEAQKYEIDRQNDLC